MQELIVNILLIVVVLTAAEFLATAGNPKNGMTKKREKYAEAHPDCIVHAFGRCRFFSSELLAQVDELLFPSAGRWLRFALYLVDYFIIGHDILRKAIKGIRNRRVFDENFLMAVATVGAMVLAVSSDGDYFEAIAVMLFYQVGEWFQGYAVGKSRRNISELMDIRPDYANIENDGKLETG